MIELTKINRESVWINPFQVEAVTRQMETHISMINSHKHIVLETPEEIRDKSLAFMKEVGIVGSHFLVPDRS